MASGSQDLHYTLKEYLAFEASSSVNNLAGQIYAMAGGTPEHAALAAALHGQLRRGRYRNYDSDLHVRMRATVLVTYRDVTVVRGPVERDREDGNSALNPAERGSMSANCIRLSQSP